MSSFQLFSTLGCHLCDEAEAILGQLRASGLSLTWTRVEIADSDEMIERYGIRIPVLLAQSNQAELDWPFDAEQASLFIKKNNV